MALEQCFWDFLLSVDAEQNPRGQEFMKKVATAFIANDALNELDLVGMDINDCAKGT